MSSAPASKLIPGVLGGFVAAYGMWAVLTRDSSSKLPHTIRNPEWAPATAKYVDAHPRQGSETPVSLNPSRFF